MLLSIARYISLSFTGKLKWTIVTYWCYFCQLYNKCMWQPNCWEMRVGCTVKIRLATLCLKNKGGTSVEIDAVRSSDRTKSVVLDTRLE